MSANDHKISEEERWFKDGVDVNVGNALRYNSS
jgi:hypothetical protein